MAAVSFTNSGVVGPNAGAVTYTLDGAAFTGGTVDWGTVTPGQSYNKPLNLVNGRNTVVTPTLTCTPPTGWSVIWSLHNVECQPLQTTAGTLTLTVASDAVEGPFTITASLSP